ncbi:hypothetical protein EZL74_00385 [Flavobacterium silvisoli]|uniref:Rieske domain-containing protein n=1 Tax=Flavobacterium silvisoli TaxID=2529433 RepID=A0A4Q9Z3L9_9FLAO|nr:hypothetical protein [Flavobacterium silvisoli]TBX70993.1 hypothetical protein EZL74_00385 [Flavobacterium silvisoli]
MKKILMLSLLAVIVLGCENARINNNNPNIPNYPVNLQINMDLPQFQHLKYPSNSYVDPSWGARGIVVFNAGNSYVAYDLACPNQSFSSCTSPMTVSGINATCSCDNTVYSLFSGQSSGQQYPMKQYRVDVSGNNLYVTNF